MDGDDGQYRQQLDITADERRAQAEEAKRKREELMASQSTPRAQRLAGRSAGPRVSTRPLRRTTPRSARGRGAPRGRGRGRAITTPLPMQSLDSKFEVPNFEGAADKVEADTPTKTAPRKRFQNSSPSRSILIPAQDDPPNASTVSSPQHPPPNLEKPVPGAQPLRSSPRIAKRTQINHPLSSSTQVLSQRAKQSKSSPARAYVEPAGNFTIPAKEGANSRPNNETVDVLSSQTPAQTTTPSPPPASATAIANPIMRSSQEQLSQQQPSKESMERVNRFIATSQPQEEIVLDGGRAQEDEPAPVRQKIDIPRSQPLPKRKRSTPMKERLVKHMRKLDGPHVDVDAPAVLAGVAAINRHTQSKRIESSSNGTGNGNIAKRRIGGSTGSNGTRGPRDGRQKTPQRDTRSENGVINLVDDEAELLQKSSAVDVQTEIHPAVISPTANNALHSETSGRKERAPISSPKRSRQLRNNVDEQTLDSGVASPIRGNASVKPVRVHMPPLRSVPNMAPRGKLDDTTSDDPVEVPAAPSTHREISRGRRHSVPPGQGGRKLAKAMQLSRVRRDPLPIGQSGRRITNSISVDLSDSEEPEARARPGELIEADMSEIMESLKDMNVTEFGIVVLHYAGITDEILRKLCPVFEGICPINRVVLCNNKIQNIVDDFRATLTKLRVVNFANNSISRVPNWVFSDCTSLVQIDLSGNGLRTIPPEIASMTQLEYLDLCRNKITALPRGLGQLRELRILDVKCNFLKQLPDDFGKENNALILMDISDNLDFCAGFPDHCASFCESIQDLFLTGTALHKELRKSQRKLSAPELVKILIGWQGQNIPGDS